MGKVKFEVLKKQIKMKRTVLFFAAAILLGLGLQSCDREDNNGGGTTTVQWVDLGLPSGLLWADRNVGASSPEDYGNYYAWGETTPKNVDTWDTYAYGNAYNALTKYCNKSDYGLDGFTDNLTTLEASDDAATVNIGSYARTPRDYEWQELMENTTVTWTTRNGVYGRKFRASNGKSIFLPATGYRYDSSLYYAGEYGFYWSSTLDTGYPGNAWYFNFDSYNQDMRNGRYRNNGFSVRAVRASQN